VSDSDDEHDGDSADNHTPPRPARHSSNPPVTTAATSEAGMATIASNKQHVRLQLEAVMREGSAVVAQHAAAGTLPPFDVASERFERVSGADHTRFLEMPSAQCLRHLFCELNSRGTADCLFHTVTWGSSILTCTCFCDSALFAVHRLFCDDSATWAQLQHAAKTPTTSAGAAATALVDMHNFAKCRKLEAARAAVIFHLLFSSYAMTTRYGWTNLENGKLNVTTGFEHLPALLQLALPELCAVVQTLQVVCTNTDCFKAPSVQPRHLKWSGDLPARTTGQTLRNVLIQQVLFPPPIPIASSSDHAGGCSFQRFERRVLCGTLPKWLMMGCNNPLHGGVTWRPEDIPDVLDLSYRDAATNTQVEAVYDLYNEFCYDGNHFVGYFVFQSQNHAAPPEVIFHDGMARPVTVFASFTQLNERRVLQLPTGYYINAMWYRMRPLGVKSVGLSVPQDQSHVVVAPQSPSPHPDTSPFASAAASASAMPPPPQMTPTLKPAALPVSTSCAADGLHL